MICRNIFIPVLNGDMSPLYGCWNEFDRPKNAQKVLLEGIHLARCSETRFDVDMQSIISGFYIALLFCYSLETHIESLIRGFYMAQRCC